MDEYVKRVDVKRVESWRLPVSRIPYRRILNGPKANLQSGAV